MASSKPHIYHRQQLTLAVPFQAMSMARLDVTETFHNIAFPGHLHTRESLHYAVNFQFQDTDTLIVSYPKSGTTWMQQILTLLYSQGDETVSHTIPNWARAPWLEQYYFPKVLEVLKEPRIITTHLQYHLLAPALEGSQAKVIYVARNPKDLAVSFYHFHKMANFLPNPDSFEEFLEHFLEGTVNYGSWFDHVKGWTSSRRNDLNFLYITYEELWEDFKGSMEKISTFLQHPLMLDDIQKIQKHCTFASMRENPMVNYTTVDKEIMDHSKGQFMRKGKVGDWKNTFTPEQNQRFENIFSLKMKNSHLKFTWNIQSDQSTQWKNQPLFWPPESQNSTFQANGCYANTSV
ncbi:sulfotransferase family 5A, member 1 isoform X1 [Brienomyrus brachyistius]|uniref:sulfotransferase family 5A, member 1 isoform X1 n=2 Tax=Brienomyrus brachyistius TaxID=42636 RepID=UPI0020B39322|nr:sulfotransferase family 5A, member 1 isoform X1 [Brienomyrus brachyistius]